MSGRTSLFYTHCNRPVWSDLSSPCVKKEQLRSIPDCIRVTTNIGIQRGTVNANDSALVLSSHVNTFTVR